ncbi:hypothetical protein [Phytoactinopolyspora limicola]|uniref:hypothetical protein n=1 Tax=Phytoactinopolyspora limicola TaxID=2715536 RepID=UPI00140B4A37|nr:hypothetical protein [Phytoactinopolyspora limicola]
MAAAVAAVALIMAGCGDDSTVADDPAPTAGSTVDDGEIPDGEPTTATTAIELCEPDLADDPIQDRSEFALVACDAPDGTNLSIVYVTPPAGQDIAVQARSSADRDETPRVTLQARGMWPDIGTGVTTVDGDRASFRYTLFWYADGAGTSERVERAFEDEVAVGDTVTHGPLTYEVRGITDTGDPETSHLDLAVTFDPAEPLE